MYTHKIYSSYISSMYKQEVVYKIPIIQIKTSSQVDGKKGATIGWYKSPTIKIARCGCTGVI